MGTRNRPARYKRQSNPKNPELVSCAHWPGNSVDNIGMVLGGDASEWEEQVGGCGGRGT